MLKRPRFLCVQISGNSFKDNVRCEGCRVRDQLMDILLIDWWWGSSVRFSSVAQWCPVNSVQPVYWFSSVQSFVSNSLGPHESQHARPPCPSPTPGVHSTHIHRVRDATQPSHTLSSPSPPAPNPSQHQNLFQWVNSLHEVAKVRSFSFNYVQ